MNSPMTKAARGFTLMETVIAIGVVAVLLTTFLAVFGPASQSIRRSLSAQDADRLQTALKRELQILREGTDKNSTSSFEKAFDWIQNSGKPEKAILLYNYRGDPTDIRTDGSLEAYQSGDANPGKSGIDFVLQPAVRRKGDSDPDLEKDLAAVEGQVYYVRMTQLVFEGGELTEGEHGKIKDPHDPAGEEITSADKYPEAVIAFNAVIYALRSNNIEYINELDLDDAANDGPDNLGKPLFSRNLGVRR